MNLTKSAFACSNLTKETLEQGVRYVQSLQKNKIEWRQWRRSDFFIVNFEHI